MHPCMPPLFMRSVDSIDEEVAHELEGMMGEVFLLGSLTHPSVSRFCALCLDPPMIVMQYYAHGSLYELLKKARRGERRAVQELSWSKRWVEAQSCFYTVGDQQAC
eukprot:GHRR01035978.1.p1 GENE.GHRR01035978.1~~GHRR01035978.1.p1  ORF type:complete len:106 (-),score=25.61 GHRR01035978.1:68-385(-)